MFYLEELGFQVLLNLGPFFFEDVQFCEVIPDEVCTFADVGIFF